MKFYKKNCKGHLVIRSGFRYFDFVAGGGHPCFTNTYLVHILFMILTFQIRNLEDFIFCLSMLSCIYMKIKSP